MTDKVEYRGWKEICNFLGVKDFRTAKKILDNHGLFEKENGKPILNAYVYFKISTKRHFNK